MEGISDISEQKRFKGRNLTKLCDTVEKYGLNVLELLLRGADRAAEIAQ